MCTIFKFNFFRFAFLSVLRLFFLQLPIDVCCFVGSHSGNCVIYNRLPLLVCAKEGRYLCTVNSIRGTLECRSGVDLFNILCLREDRPLLPFSLSLTQAQKHTLTDATRRGWSVRVRLVNTHFEYLFCESSKKFSVFRYA